MPEACPPFSARRAPVPALGIDAIFAAGVNKQCLRLI